MNTNYFVNFSKQIKSLLICANSIDKMRVGYLNTVDNNIEYRYNNK